ncbi:PIN domain-containing protein [Candidatus Daviesbacteria bacterium]|nr:PIN domain-containing protein [Candidatus Daviesbacteria bacterium]
MSKNLLDTNLIIRFLVNDNPKKVSRVEKLLSDKNNTNILLDTIVAEIIWVLSSYYSLKKSEVIEKISALIHLDSIDCNAALINKALSVWEENNVSYIDSYLVAVAKLGNIPLFSYDDKLKSINQVTVKEP